MAETRFRYKPNTVVFVFGALLFFGVAVISGLLAVNNDKGLVLNGIIEFSETGATIFYWCLTVISGLFVGFASMALYSGLTTKKEVILTNVAISAPKSGLSKTIVPVQYDEITDVNIQSVNKSRFLNILYPNGKLIISQSMLPNKQAFEELVQLVAAKASR